MAPVDRKLYVLPNDTAIVNLDCQKAWDGLTAKERLYSHHLCRASFEGGVIVFLQTSPESPLIYVLFQKVFRDQTPNELKKVALEKGVTEDEFTALLVYLSGFISNTGNYKGFGDTKFVPDIPKDKLWAVIESSKAYGGADKAVIDELWAGAGDAMYDLADHRLRLGFGTKSASVAAAKKKGSDSKNDSEKDKGLPSKTSSKKGLTTYLSSNISKEEVELVDRFCTQHSLELWNTRLFKTVSDDGKSKFEIRLASVDTGVARPAEEFEGVTIEVVRGDYSPILKRVIHHLTEARKSAANDHERAMLTKYISHFQTGSLNDHKDGSRHWIKDIGPVVESYIGFIENYRDPAGTRSEFEGFVSAVDKDMTKKFQNLVENAEKLLTRLPWGPAYEKNKFLKPDFTSLDIIGMGGSGVPAGINIPNYDDIRQDEGFKNVSLGNVIASTPHRKLNFLSAEDDAHYRKYHKHSFEVQVGLHELLGHGSGKLFIRGKDGKYNFDHENVTDLDTGKQVTSWYEEGETWGSKFGALASAYEECRAEAVGYVLCCYPDVLEIFGYNGEEAAEIKYDNWLGEIRAGLLGLEFYSPESKSWGQAHCYARYVLFEVSLRAGQGFVKVEEVTGEDGKPDLLFTLDRTKIDSVGKPATNDFLKKLQLYKSTGDSKKGHALFKDYGTPTEQALKWREIVVARRQPRRIFIQANTKLNEQGEAVLKKYEESAGGCVLSHVERYDAGIDGELLALATADKKHFQY